MTPHDQALASAVDAMLSGDLADQVAALPMPAGWSFAYEYPGAFTFTHDSGVIVLATPDFEVSDAIPIVSAPSWDAYQDRGEVEITHDHPWPQDGRSAAAYMAAVAPYLTTAIHGREILLTVAHDDDPPGPATSLIDLLAVDELIDVAALVALAPGEIYTCGGGAAPLCRVERVS